MTVDTIYEECEAKNIPPTVASSTVFGDRGYSYLPKLRIGTRKRFDIGEVAHFAEVLGISLTDLIAKVEEKHAVLLAEEAQRQADEKAIVDLAEATASHTLSENTVIAALRVLGHYLPPEIMNSAAVSKAFSALETESGEKGLDPAESMAG